MAPGGLAAVAWTLSSVHDHEADANPGVPHNPPPPNIIINRSAPSKSWWVTIASWITGFVSAYFVAGMLVMVPLQYFIGYPLAVERHERAKDKVR
jgi:hypothetical protein